MNIRRTFAVALAIVCAGTPALASAASDQASLAACARVFTASLATRGVAFARYAISFLNHGYVATAADYAAGIYTYDLMARDSKTGAPMASAACSVDESGAVSALLVEPLPPPSPVLADRL